MRSPLCVHVRLYRRTRKKYTCSRHTVATSLCESYKLAIGNYRQIEKLSAVVEKLGRKIQDRGSRRVEKQAQEIVIKTGDGETREEFSSWQRRVSGRKFCPNILYGGAKGGTMDRSVSFRFKKIPSCRILATMEERSSFVNRETRRRFTVNFLLTESRLFLRVARFKRLGTGDSSV